MRRKTRRMQRARILAAEGPREIEVPTTPPAFIVTESEMETPGGGVVATLEVGDPNKRCLCTLYEGENYQCKVHDPKVECPKCHCVDSEERTSDRMPSVKHYRCSICGVFYLRIEETGEYILN